MQGCRARSRLAEAAASVVWRTPRRGVSPYGIIFTRARLRRRGQAPQWVQQYQNCERLLGATQQWSCYAALQIRQNIFLVARDRRAAIPLSVPGYQRQLDVTRLRGCVIDMLHRLAIVS